MNWAPANKTSNRGPPGPRDDVRQRANPAPRRTYARIARPSTGERVASIAVARSQPLAWILVCAPRNGASDLGGSGRVGEGIRGASLGYRAGAGSTSKRIRGYDPSASGGPIRLATRSVPAQDPPVHTPCADYGRRLTRRDTPSSRGSPLGTYSQRSQTPVAGSCRRCLGQMPKSRSARFLDRS